MIVLFIVLLVRGSVSKSSDEEVAQGVTPHLVHIDEMPNLGVFDDAQHRGPSWYEHMTESDGADSDMEGTSDDESTGGSKSGSGSSQQSSDEDLSTSASSFETKERKAGKRVYRVCTPCPQDMMKRYKNMGIKWHCGGYQRARRSFKSVCMMRYRNCEDGTMFVKLYAGRCKNDTYHGNHWFYIYKT